MTAQREPGAPGPRARLLAWVRFAAVVLAVGVVLAVAWALTRGDDEVNTGAADADGGLGLLQDGAPEIGQAAPDFALTTPDGTTVRLSDFRGRPVLLNFWATWCAPCREEMPAFERAYSEADGGMTVLAVNFRESGSAAAAFTEELGLTFPVVLDSKGEVAERYGITGLPSTFFLDADGVVRALHFGPIDEETIREKLAQAGG